MSASCPKAELSLDCPRTTTPRRGRIVVECARLESEYTARYQEFESLPLRHEILIIDGVFIFVESRISHFVDSRLPEMDQKGYMSCSIRLIPSEGKSIRDDRIKRDGRRYSSSRGPESLHLRHDTPKAEARVISAKRNSSVLRPACLPLPFRARECERKRLK